jgi:hypothetical protein
MDTQRITISIPNYLYQQIIDTVPKRKVSSYLAGIIEERIVCGNKDCDPVEDFFNLRKKVPKISFQDIKIAIEKGRK